MDKACAEHGLVLEFGGFVGGAAASAAVLALGFMREWAGGLLVIWLFAVVWASDTAAYAAGRLVGGAKLAPAISPNKTWAGAAGALLGAAFAAVVFWPFLNTAASFSSVLLLALWGSAGAQAGDMAESWIKRRAGVKDAGGLIPGHGGLLDRADSMIGALWFLTPAVVLAW